MILVENGVVIAKFDAYEQKENGKLINGSIFPMGDVVNVSAPAEVVPQKYCYDTTNGFYLNPNYTTPSEDRITQLEAQNAQMLLALVNGGLM